MSLDSEELKKMLKKRKRNKPLKEEVSGKQPSVRIAKRLVDVRTGVPIAEEEEVASLRSKGEVLEEEIVCAVETCPTCGRSISQELLSRHEVKTCIICGRDTYPACRVNTSIPTMDVRYRGQIICQDCFRLFRECQICRVLTHPDNLIRCESCNKLVCIDHARKRRILFWWKVECVECTGEYIPPTATPIQTQPQAEPRWVICPNCGGRGIIKRGFWYRAFVYDPNVVRWAGMSDPERDKEVEGKPCPVCHGSGRILVR